MGSRDDEKGWIKQRVWACESPATDLELCRVLQINLNIDVI